MTIVRADDYLYGSELGTFVARRKVSLSMGLRPRLTSGLTPPRTLGLRTDVMWDREEMLATVEGANTGNVGLMDWPNASPLSARHPGDEEEEAFEEEADDEVDLDDDLDDDLDLDDDDDDLDDDEDDDLEDDDMSEIDEIELDDEEDDLDDDDDDDDDLDFDDDDEEDEVEDL